MKREEHFNWLIAEECAEVVQRISKAARFGFDEKQVGQDLTNLERLKYELNDLFAAIEILTEKPLADMVDRNMINLKKAKIEKYLKHSKECGTLED